MDESLHNDDLLIRYLDGELRGNEKEELETRLKTDKNLQSELANLRIAIQAVRQFGVAQQVGSIHQEMMTELKGQKRGRVVSFKRAIRYTMAIAASALVIFIGIRLFLNSQPSSEKLYKETFVDYDLSATRGNESNNSDIDKLYQQKNYQAVTTTSRSRTLSAKDSLLIGLSNLHINKNEQAIQFFEKMSAVENDFQQDAEFYLSLSYLKERSYKKAAAIMRKIRSNIEHLYHQQISPELVDAVEGLDEE